LVEGALKCGFVAIVGAPNVGKSTLLNFLVGTKVSIVSPKVQTTRSRVLGICIVGASQLVLVDTPGVFKPRRRLDRAMVAAAWGGAKEADFLLLLVDSAAGLDTDTRAIVARLEAEGNKAILVLNKVDAVKKPALLKLATNLNGVGNFTHTFMISALTGSGVPDLLAHLAGVMPEGPWLYPEDQLSDMPGRLLAAELTREKIYLQLHKELPYAASVDTETWKENKDGSVRIGVTIYVERPSQKAIVLGKGGVRVKAIGEAARIELEELLERRVHLFLFVKVRKDWGEDPERYRDLGLDYKA